MRDGRCIGLISLPELVEHMRNTPLATAQSLARNVPAVVPQDTLERAATLLADPAFPALPVEAPQTHEFLGIVTRRDVLEAYRSAVML
jgi:CBS domain-containing protein